MSILATTKVCDVKILNTTLRSNIIACAETFEDAENLVLAAIDVVDGVKTYTLEVTTDADPRAPGAVYRTFQILNGAALANMPVPNTNNSAFVLPWGLAAATGFQIVISAAAGRDNIFRLSKQFAK